MRTPSLHSKHLALALGLVAITVGGACGSSSDPVDSSPGNRDALTDSPVYDAEIVADASVADTAIPDLAQADVNPGTEAGHPDAGVDVGGSDVRSDVGPLDVGADRADVAVDAAPKPEVGAEVNAQDAEENSQDADETPIDGGPTPSTPNLIVNGDAEAAVGSADGLPVQTPGWTVTGDATAIKYGVDGYAVATDPGPANRGLNYFTGGIAAASTLSQTISLESYASAIAGHTVTFILSGYIGAYSGQLDNAVLTASFRNAGGVELSKASIGPVTADDLEGATGMLFRSTIGTVPSAARSVLVTLTMTRFEGNAADGYADNLSLALSGT